jgi:hypothetical protein
MQSNGFGVPRGAVDKFHDAISVGLFSEDV